MLITSGICGICYQGLDFSHLASKQCDVGGKLSNNNQLFVLLLEEGFVYELVKTPEINFKDTSGDIYIFFFLMSANPMNSPAGPNTHVYISGGLIYP